MSPHTSQSSRVSRPQIKWQQGVIAFLRHYDTYSPKDYADLISSGYLAKEATVHPVILLAVLNDKAIITTISAFRTEENQSLAPWQQKWHQSKNRDHFRAFEGTPRPNNKYPALRLANSGMRLPKPEASWVYAKSFVCVPFSVLGWFNKSPALLRVHPDSLRQHTLDMKCSFPQQYNDAGTRLHGAEAAIGAANVAQTPQAHRLITTAATSFTRGARRPNAIQSRHIVARTPGIRVTS